MKREKGSSDAKYVYTKHNTCISSDMWRKFRGKTFITLTEGEVVEVVDNGETEYIFRDGVCLYTRVCNTI